MPTLTPSQIDDFRQDSGDNTFPPKIPTPKIQEWYDAVYPDADNDDQAYARVMVRILRRLLAEAAKLVDKRGEVEAESRSQYFKNLTEKVLPMWEELAGLNTVGGITTGALVLNIDYNEEDYEAEWDS